MGEERNKKGHETVTVGSGDLTWITKLESSKQQLALYPDAVIELDIAYKRLFLTARLDELGSEWVKLGPVKDGEKITQGGGLIFKPDSEIYEDLYLPMNGKIVHLRVPVVRKIKRD
jgi:hypothetical protein